MCFYGNIISLKHRGNKGCWRILGICLEDNFNFGPMLFCNFTVSFWNSSAFWKDSLFFKFLEDSYLYGLGEMYVGKCVSHKEE